MTLTQHFPVGYPGGAILPVFDAIYNSKDFEFILPRHEQGAGHMAEGYARASGKTGVVLVTSGPGATNLVTGLADALLDSIPMVAITGQVRRMCDPGICLRCRILRASNIDSAPY